MSKQTIGSEENDEIKAWMQQLAALPLNESKLPDPALLWWKAELLRRWDDQRRTAAPLETGERVQVGICLAGATALLIGLFKTGLPQPLAVVMTLSIVTVFVFTAVTLRRIIAGD